ncbi:hypothetical protein AB0C34_16965 [Nocardia sp. NPDC049220]|uniref:hypothetical protein n=1 Tax=Nocardia sp. NPDC049220 TaxID=3155273 RepID=UPI0033DAA5BD
MTETPGLEWLTVGATVAHIFGRYRDESVSEAMVTKIGKRDVVITVEGRTEKFNIGHTKKIGDNTWLRRSVASSSDRVVYLAPLGDPRVASYRQQQARNESTKRVRHYADKFQNRRDVDTAKKLRAAVDTYLALLDTDKD